MIGVNTLKRIELNHKISLKIPKKNRFQFKEFYVKFANIDWSFDKHFSFDGLFAGRDLHFQILS